MHELDAGRRSRTRLTTERVLALLRVAVVGYAAFQATTTTWPSSSLRIVAYGAVAVLGLAGILTAVLTLGGEDHPDRVEKLSRWTFALDCALLAALPLVFAFHDGDSTHLLPLLLPLEGALKFDLRGGIAGVAVVAAAEVARATLSTEVWGLEPQWMQLLSQVLIAVFVGLIAGLLARSAQREQAAAQREAERATALAQVAERTNRDLAALHRVVLAGIGGREEDALHRMVNEVRAQLSYPYVAVILLDSAGKPYQAATSGGDPTQDTSIVIDRGGPVERALSGGEAQFVTADRLGAVHRALPDAEAQVVAPIRLRTRTIGALVIELDDTLPVSGTALQPLQRLADQMGLVIEAARAFEREVEIAERYQELDRLKTDFVAITSHELRTPLTAILGFAENLARRHDRITPELRERMVDSILRQARRLARLVDDLRTVSRIDAGTLTINPRISNVTDIVTDVLEATRLEDGVRTRGPATVPVYADPERLSQVLTNLLNNAADHGDPPIELTWGIEGPWATVRVSDSGKGIPERHRDAIFDRFYQAGDVNAHQRGSGLGLSIARELTEAMAGRLELDPTVTRGACFVVRLPIAQTDGLPETDVVPERTQPEDRTSDTPATLRRIS